MARNLTMRQAINEALDQEMTRDPTVIVMGEDIVGGAGGTGERDAWGGALGVTKGLYAKHGDRLLDTLVLARRKHPNAPNRLDDLCGRYGIDNAHRTKHGALLDAEILAEVYLELIGARQAQLGLGEAAVEAAAIRIGQVGAATRPEPIAPRLTAAELEAHLAFVATLGASAIWRRYNGLDTRHAAAG